MKSINPVTGVVFKEYAVFDGDATNAAVDSVYDAWMAWRETPMDHRSTLLQRTASVLREGKNRFARLMTLEMGKLLREAEAEVEKCAWVCEYYATHGPYMLQDKVVQTDAQRSLIAFQPLGPILAVMPWNFPFWQVFRFAAPALMGGNAALLKHASNVPGCALAIEEIFRSGGFPEHLFRTLLIPSAAVEAVIAHPKVAAVTLTGSEAAGASVAATAGRHLKKSLLELGGSDPFIVLEDADLEAAIRTAVTARMINQGQSCIAAKRFIVVEAMADRFVAGVKTALESLVVGDPMDSTTQVGPLARPDLVEEIDRQVKESVRQGARLITGGVRPNLAGAYYSPTLLDGVVKGMEVYHQETFGPVVAVIRVQNEKEAIEVANDTEFGLGGCVWTADTARGERIARAIETGAVFVNGMTKSDPRLPFGGIKKSGYGRELSSFGIREFMNIKTIWVG